MIGILIFPDFQLLDAAGPISVFEIAARYASAHPVIRVMAAEPGPVRSSSGVEMMARKFGPAGAITTLLIAGGDGVETAARNACTLKFVQSVARRGVRVASVCSGTFILAEAGLLGGRRATTHWQRTRQFLATYPDVKLEPDQIYVRDGHIWSSAGITAGIDLALQLVEEDCGRDVALTVARWLVMFLRRPGGQSQFSAQLSAQLAERDGLRDVQGWIAEHPEAELTVPALARRAHMSPRNFARAFRRETGVTPAAYVEAQRVEAARRLLETTAGNVAEVATACGFGRPETMHRAFRRVVHIAPAQYRRHFRTMQPTAG